MESLSDLEKKARQLRNQGQYSDAEVFYRRIVIAQEQEFGTVHPFLVGTLNNLAMVLSELGNYPEAVKSAERALSIIEQQLDIMSVSRK